MNYFIAFILLFTLVGCDSADLPSASYQEITGREEGALYRIKAPIHWERKSLNGSLQDTTLPLAEFLVDSSIRVTLHNFPEIKVPPQAQIARWKKQITSLDLQGTTVVPQAFSGYVGLKFEGSGLIDGKKISMIGWSLQLGPEFSPFVKGESAADVTIKVVGPIDEIESNKEEIEQFARSFELIEDLPTNRMY